MDPIDAVEFETDFDLFIHRFLNHRVTVMLGYSIGVVIGICIILLHAVLLVNSDCTRGDLVDGDFACLDKPPVVDRSMAGATPTGPFMTMYQADERGPYASVLQPTQDPGFTYVSFNAWFYDPLPTEDEPNPRARWMRSDETKESILFRVKLGNAITITDCGEKLENITHCLAIERLE